MLSSEPIPLNAHYGPSSHTHVSHQVSRSFIPSVLTPSLYRLLSLCDDFVFSRQHADAANLFAMRSEWGKWRFLSRDVRAQVVGGCLSTAAVR